MGAKVEIQLKLVSIVKNATIFIEIYVQVGRMTVKFQLILVQLGMQLVSLKPLFKLHPWLNSGLDLY